MSDCANIEWRNGWATDDGLRLEVRGTLSVIAAHMDAGAYRKGISSLADMAGKSKRTVSRHLQEATQRGWLERIERTPQFVEFHAKVPDTDDGVPDTDDGVPDTDDGVPDTDDGVPDTDDGVPDTDDGVPDTDDGVPDTDDGVPDTDDGWGDSSSPSPSKDKTKVSTPSKEKPDPSSTPSPSAAATAPLLACDDSEPEPDTEPDDQNDLAADGGSELEDDPHDSEAADDLSAYEQLFEIDDASRFVEALADFHGVPISSPGTLWMQARGNAPEASEDQLRAYLDAKLADLAADERDFPARTIQKYTRQDASDWEEVIGESDDRRSSSTQQTRYPGQLDDELGRDDDLDELLNEGATT